MIDYLTIQTQKVSIDFHRKKMFSKKINDEVEFVYGHLFYFLLKMLLSREGGFISLVFCLVYKCETVFERVRL